MEVEKLEREKITRDRTLKEPAYWMITLANKYGIESDTVLGFFNSIHYDRINRRTKRKRTEEFFELYFEGVKDNG